jgi:hypothetical protein
MALVLLALGLALQLSSLFVTAIRHREESTWQWWVGALAALIFLSALCFVPKWRVVTILTVLVEVIYGTIGFVVMWARLPTHLEPISPSAVLPTRVFLTLCLVGAWACASTVWSSCSAHRQRMVEAILAGLLLPQAIGWLVSGFRGRPPRNEQEQNLLQA